MASKVCTFRLPAALEEAAKLRCNALGYKDITSLIKGLLRYDILVQGPHSVTLPISERSLAEQDAFDVKLLALAKQGRGERGQLLARIVEAAQKNNQSIVEFLLDDATDNPPKD